MAPPPPPPRTKWTRHVPHPVLIGHAASLSQTFDPLEEGCQLDRETLEDHLAEAPPPPPSPSRTNRTRLEDHLAEARPAPPRAAPRRPAPPAGRRPRGGARRK